MWGTPPRVRASDERARARSPSRASLSMLHAFRAELYESPHPARPGAPLVPPPRVAAGDDPDGDAARAAIAAAEARDAADAAKAAEASGSVGSCSA